MQYSKSALCALDPACVLSVTIGGAGTGKTQLLINRACALVGAGVAPSNVLMIAASPSAADALRVRLSNTPADSVRVQVAEEAAVALLSNEEALAASGRVPRVLEEPEVVVLMEDMKVTGVEPKRLREMLKFFYKRMAELTDANDDFLVTEEERLVYDALQVHLKHRRAMLVQELGGCVTRWLQAHPNYALADHVLVDDFQNLSLAMQTFCQLAAKSTFAVAGNPNQCAPAREAYPHAVGLLTLAQQHKCVRVDLGEALRAPARVAAAVDALVQAPGMDATTGAPALPSVPAGSVRAVKWTVPSSEFRGVAQWLANMTRGEAGQPTHARDMAIIVPNALWGRAFAKALELQGVASSLCVGAHALPGDPRTIEKSAALRAYAGLCLAADAHDAVAWRSWCGFGNYLLNSNHWCRLEQWAKEQNLNVVAALDLANVHIKAGAAAPFLGAAELCERYRAGQALLECTQGKVGFALLNLLVDDPAAGLPAGFANLVEPVCGTESAQELISRARGRFADRFSAEDAVSIGLPETMCGREYKVVVWAGAVDGFYPTGDTFGEKLEEDRKADLRAKQRRALYAALGTCSRDLVISCFERDEVKSASALGMRIARVRDMAGEQMATLIPSAFIAEMADAAPGFDSKL